MLLIPSFLHTDPSTAYAQDLECLTTASGIGYRGRVDRTVGGLLCQRWDIQSPHTHKFNVDSWFPGGGVTRAENYCRNLEGWLMPWCYTLDPDTRWDNCSIPMCSKLLMESMSDILCGKC